MEHTWTMGSITTSRTIYGCMRLGGTWDALPPDDTAYERAFAALDSALAAGITVFDHADIYCHGKSETLFGEWLRARPGIRDRITIQTKCGIILPSGTPTTIYDFSRDHIIASIEGSLERLGVDVIDVLLLHRPDPLCDPPEVARAWSEISSRGLAVHLGVSNHSASQIDILRQATGSDIVANQVEISLAHPDLLIAGTAWNQRHPSHPLRDGGVIEDALSQGTQLQAWSPLAGGKYLAASPHINPECDETARDEKVAKLLTQLADRYDVSVEAIMLAWVMRHPSHIMPVIGTMDPKRIGKCVEAERVSLSREDWYLLTAAARGHAMP